MGEILTIIGNGFDLGHCLPTTFENFIKFRYNKLINGKDKSRCLIVMNSCKRTLKKSLLGDCKQNKKITY